MVRCHDVRPRCKGEIPCTQEGTRQGIVPKQSIIKIKETMSIKSKLIHFLGGVTLKEQTESNQQSYDVGLTFAFKAIKSFADSIYGTPSDEWCKKMYGYISECESEYKRQDVEITESLLEANGWQVHNAGEQCLYIPIFAELVKDGFRAEWEFGRTSLRIWPDAECGEDIASDIYVRNCETADKMTAAFKLAGIDYHLVIPQTEDD